MKRYLIYKNHNASEDVLHLFSIEQQRLLFEGNIEFCMLWPFHLQQDTIQNPFPYHMTSRNLYFELNKIISVI